VLATPQMKSLESPQCLLIINNILDKQTAYGQVMGSYGGGRFSRSKLFEPNGKASDISIKT